MEQVEGSQFVDKMEIVYEYNDEDGKKATKTLSDADLKAEELTYKDDGNYLSERTIDLGKELVTSMQIYVQNLQDQADQSPTFKITVLQDFTGDAEEDKFLGFIDAEVSDE